MYSHSLKFLPIILLGTALIFWGCHQRQIQIPILASVSNLSEVAASESARKPTSLSITEQIYQQAEKDLPFPKIAEVPFLSVRLSNYLARNNGKIGTCGGETQQPFYRSYFPKLYRLNPREYLVEQICSLGAYNIRFSYLLYHLESSLDASQLKNRPQNDYGRDDYGYYYLRENKLDQFEPTIPAGTLIPLTFDTYHIDESGKQMKAVSNVTGGKRLFDVNQRTLWVLSKGRGMGDCGDFARYQLEEDSFKLLEYRSQKCCSTQQECNAPSYRRPPHEYPQVYP